MTEKEQERFEVLGECLTLVEAQVRLFSNNQAMLSAKQGYEKAWEQEQKKRQVLQEMMRELRAGA